MKAAIIYDRFLNSDGTNYVVGGIETYLLNLAKLCVENDMQTFIWQSGSHNFKTVLKNITVLGVPVQQMRASRRINKLVSTAIKNVDLKNDLVIFGADRYARPIGSNRCISIQHGIAIDLPMYHHEHRGRLQNLLGDRIYQAIRRQRALKEYLQCPNRVCVDYNYLNWYRTFLYSEPRGREWVIPNFTRIASRTELTDRHKDNKTIRILFARRFIKYRGTRLMAEAVNNILQNHSNVNVTFAGEGPDEAWLRAAFNNDARINFTKYHPDDAIKFHLQYDIAVVPSLGSEGTSLAVAEAMGAHCAVVATAVGGITNMIINGYNGMLCMPNVSDLRQCIETLIDDKKKMAEISARGYETAKEAFSLEKWRKAWTTVINQVLA
jgi:glycosyltransferase involved in cell wall biosynthesis